MLLSAVPKRADVLGTVWAVFLGMGNFPNFGDFEGLVGKKTSWGIPIQIVGNFVLGTL